MHVNLSPKQPEILPFTFRKGIILLLLTVLTFVCMLMRASEPDLTNAAEAYLFLSLHVSLYLF